MSEKRLVVNNLEIHYKGLFDFVDFLQSVWDAVESRGYHKHEKRYEETVKPTGKDIFIELRPYKKKIDYYALMLKIRIEMTNVRDVVVEVDGLPSHFQEGSIDMTFDAWATTDYKKRWGNKPVVYFLKSAIHKYIYRFPLEEGFVGELAVDVKDVVHQIESFLNLYRYKVGSEKVEEKQETQ
jgi:hypothetical protein